MQILFYMRASKQIFAGNKNREETQQENKTNMHLDVVILIHRGMVFQL